MLDPTGTKIFFLNLCAIVRHRCAIGYPHGAARCANSAPTAVE